MDHEILVKIKYSWLQSRGHAKMCACAKNHCCRTNSYWGTDLNQKVIKVQSNMNDCIQDIMLRCTHMPSITAVGPIVTEKLTQTEKEGRDVPVTLNLSIIALREPDLEMIKANILTKFMMITLTRQCSMPHWPWNIGQGQIWMTALKGSC